MYNTIWIDYFTGEQYRGGQVLNDFDAPLWKLPVFVKANAIIPMYEPNNNPQDIDRSVRNVEFFATAGENSYTQFEDDGIFIDSDLKESEDKEYGTENHVNYGDHVSTTYKSSVKGDVATFTAEKSTGGYKGYAPEHTTSFVVNVSKEPTSVVAKNGDAALKKVEVKTQEEFDKAQPKDGEFVYFYNAKPNLNYGSSSDATDVVKKEGFSSQEILTTPKLYVKFAKTDVQKNVRSLELSGFKNEGAFDANVEDANLQVPTLKQPSEENGDLTPTSFRLNWDKVEGATSYDIMVDGTVNSVPAGTPEEPITSLTITDQAYNSTHKVKIRQRTAKGYSKWSEEITAVTLKDPWHNTPSPVSVKFDGGVWAGSDSYKEMNAFDHNVADGSNMFHSGDNAAEGQAMTVDYGTAYQFDKLGYWPRTDVAGAVASGTVLQMKAETSLDGVHWVDCGTSNWENTRDYKEFPLNQTVRARYVRLTPVDTNNGYFTALELAMYKVDGSSAFEVGSIAGDGKVTDADYQHLKGNCIGRENRAPLDTDWSSHIAPNGADFNLNGAYDAYDMAFTMSKLDGGTIKSDKVSGNIVVVPSQTTVEAGDVITVDLYTDDIKNANALGALINFQGDAFEYVNDSLTKSPYTASMEDLSKVTTNFVDGKQSVNISFQNRGGNRISTAAPGPWRPSSSRPRRPARSSFPRPRGPWARSSITSRRWTMTPSTTPMLPSPRPASSPWATSI